MLFEHHRRSGADGHIEDAVAPDVEPADEQVLCFEPVLLCCHAELIIGEEGHVPKLVGITDDHGAACPQQCGGGKGLVDGGGLVENDQVEERRSGW